MYPKTNLHIHLNVISYPLFGSQPFLTIDSLKDSGNILSASDVTNLQPKVI